MPLPGALKGFRSLMKAGRALAAGQAKGAAPVGFPIGLDFGTGSLKALYLQPGDAPSLGGAASIETPEELRSDAVKRLAFQTRALPALIKKLGAKTRRVTCAIPSWATVCKHLQLTKCDSASGLADQVLQQIPAALNCDPSTISFKFLEITPPGSFKPEVIVMAVSRDLVTMLMTAVRDAKLEPVGMHSEFMAILGAFDYVHRRAGDEDTNTLYLDIGYGTTCVAISHGRQLAFARVIDLGGGSIDEALSRELSCSRNDAHAQRLCTAPGAGAATMAAQGDPRRLAVAGADYNVEIDRRTGNATAGLLDPMHMSLLTESTRVGPDLTESLETLTDEVKMCLRFHAGQFPQRKVQRLIFVGGESSDRGLCLHISKVLKLQAYIADPFGRFHKVNGPGDMGPGGAPSSTVHVDLTRPQPGWAVAMGLCVCPTDL